MGWFAAIWRFSLYNKFTETFVSSREKNKFTAKQKLRLSGD
jgi:hypothetical protein